VAGRGVDDQVEVFLGAVCVLQKGVLHDAVVPVVGLEVFEVDVFVDYLYIHFVKDL